MKLAALLLLPPLLRQAIAYTTLSDSSLRALLPATDADFNIHTGRLLAPILQPRVPGTPGSAAVLAHFVNYFTTHLPDWDLTFQNSTSTTPTSHGKDVPFINLIATRDPPWLNGQQGEVARQALVAHYDSKLTPTGFIGATDSAAPCAMLLHVAQSLDAALTRKWTAMAAEGLGAGGYGGVEDHKGLQIILLDGEEAFQTWTHTDSLYGARALAEEWEGTVNSAMSTFQSPLDSIELFVLLDLLGSANPIVPSYFKTTHWAYQLLADVEQRLRGLSSGGPAVLTTNPNRPFLPEANKGESNANERWLGGYIEDDHLPFMARGVEILHLIPSPFPHVWHTMQDDGEHLDIATVRDWAAITAAFAAEWMDLEGFLEDGQSESASKRSWENEKTELPSLPGYQPSPDRSPRSVPRHRGPDLNAGRRDPLTRTPLTPLATVWSSIQNAVGYIYGYPRNSAPVSPNLNGPAHGREDRWMNLRTAEGRVRLESVINDWLMMGSDDNEGLAQLIVRIAQEHGEPPEVTDERFRLRYQGVERIRNMQSQDLANRIAQMLIDELDLPGQRYSTALHSWQEIVHGARNDAGSQPPLDSEIDDDLVQRVQSFIRIHGFRIFLQCLDWTHRGDAGDLFPRFFAHGPDHHNRHGLRTAVWQPNDDDEEISHYIAGLLQGTRPLEPFTAGNRLAPGSRPEYDEEADDSPEAGEYDAEQSRGVPYSLQAIRDLIAEPGVTWRQVFHVYQRHILLYGMQDIVFDAGTTLPRGLSELMRTRPEDLAHDMARLNHRFSLEDGMAALFADAAIARSRGTTASWPLLHGGGRGRRRLSSDGRNDSSGEDENIHTGGDDGRPHHEEEEQLISLFRDPETRSGDDDGPRHEEEEEELVSLFRDPETRSGGSPLGVPVGSPVYPREYWGLPSHAGGDDRSGPNAGNNSGAQQHDETHGANLAPPSPPLRSDRDTQMTRFWRDYAASCVEVEQEAREERRAGAQSRQQWLQLEIDRLDRSLGRRRGPRLTQDELEARFAEVLARAVVASWDTAYDRMRTREQEGMFGEDAGQSHGSDDDDDHGPPPPPAGPAAAVHIPRTTIPPGTYAPPDPPSAPRARRRRSSSIIARHQRQAEAAASAGVGAVTGSPATTRKRGSTAQGQGSVDKRAKK
ncbi:hypothetical protein B0A54_13790 [Friedmanniomyces endolithicus]|uniref:Peptide hydrolase n=1 Tax=Friedmanniomyces endolithicus TaxID=329885 RepID=A0A4U0UIQ8_9PEZI|nr:hypothetical protein B0A54_13790 [Friedmanniomyces endolithicus]